MDQILYIRDRFFRLVRLLLLIRDRFFRLVILLLLMLVLLFESKESIRARNSNALPYSLIGLISAAANVGSLERFKLG